jgi:hypothetical protein
MAIDTVAQLLATAENPPNIEPLGSPYNSEDGYTCFDGYLAIGGVNGNSFDVPNLNYLQGGSGAAPQPSDISFPNSTPSTLGSVVHPVSLIPQVAVVPVTSAQLLALHTTPITILAAAPAGMAYVIDKAICNYIYLTAGYTGTGSNLELETWDGTHATVLQTLADAILDVGAFNAVGVFTDNQPTNITELHSSYMIAQPVRLVTTKAGNYTVGAGSIVLTVFYRLVPLS